MSTTRIKFPRLYAWSVRLLHAELSPRQFFDLFILGFVALAFFMATYGMGMISMSNTAHAPRLLACALSLSAFSMISRSQTGFRIRWLGLLFLPFALWLLFDAGPFGVAWRAREQASVAFCGVATFWIVVHHMRHEVHRWALWIAIIFVAATFACLMISDERNLLPYMAEVSASTLYEGRSTGPFGTPGAFGTMLLMAFFPAFAVTISPNLEFTRRFAATIATIAIGFGILKTQCGPVVWGLCGGVAVIAWLLTTNKVRAATIAGAAIGAGFFSDRFSSFTDGVFRSEIRDRGQNITPLFEASSQLFERSPLTGIGSGGFLSAFETVRPAGYHPDPTGAGGFFHQLATENGIVGIALFAVPCLALWFFTMRACLRVPKRLTHNDPQFHKRISYAPEARVALSAVLASSLAGAIALTFDYASPNLTITLAFAICGGIAVGMIAPDTLNTEVLARMKPRFIIRTVLAAIPVAAFSWYCHPVFESAQLARLAETQIRDAESSARFDKFKKTSVNRRFREISLQSGINAAEASLRFMPDNARAAAALADGCATQLRSTGKSTGMGPALAAARLAADTSGGEVKLSLPLVTTLRIHGRTAEAEALLDKLHERAPTNFAISIIRAKMLLANGKSKAAYDAADEVFRVEPWNDAAKNIRNISGLNANPSNP